LPSKFFWASNFIFFTFFVDRTHRTPRWLSA
jgi:hypothetical protein